MFASFCSRKVEIVPLRDLRDGLQRPLLLAVARQQVPPTLEWLFLLWQKEVL